MLRIKYIFLRLMNNIELKPIGYVRNNITKRSDMTVYGVRSAIEILPEFIPALGSIEENSHLIVCCCFHNGKRDVLRVHPRKFNVYSMSEKGVFATRSPDRPNPISFSVVKLIRRNGNVLEVENLDIIDGAPVIDLKPYITESDAIFNTKRFTVSSSFSKTSKEALVRFLESGVENFIHCEDGFLDVAIESLCRMIKKIDRMPDRTIVDHVETDYVGNALDCIFYYTKFTPGEGKISYNSEKSKNSFIRFFMKSGDIETFQGVAEPQPIWFQS